MKIEVKDKWAVMVKDDTLQQNASKSYEVEFEFNKSWDGFSKTVIFEAGTAIVVVTLTEDRCAIPAKCLKRGSVNLKIGIYGVKGSERKGTVWCSGGMIISNMSMDIGTRPPSSNDVYAEIMAAIGDLSAAGFEGKTLSEVFRELKNSVCETAADTEVDTILDTAFGPSISLPENPGGESPNNTAMDEEVDDLLNEIFSK